VTPKAKRIFTTIVFQRFKHVSASNQILLAFGAPHTCSLYFIHDQSSQVHGKNINYDIIVAERVN